MIGFGQVDKIIFSSGDTIYGKVIEVGVNNITYQHKNEITNNVTKKRDIAKVIYSSGRIETFDGLQILKRNQEGKIRYFIFSDSKIPFYYSNQPKEESFGSLPMQRRQFNLQLNTTISVGIGANF